MQKFEFNETASFDDNQSFSSPRIAKRNVSNEKSLHQLFSSDEDIQLPIKKILDN